MNRNLTRLNMILINFYYDLNFEFHSDLHGFYSVFYFLFRMPNYVLNNVAVIQIVQVALNHEIHFVAGVHWKYVVPFAVRVLKIQVHHIGCLWAPIKVHRFRNGVTRTNTNQSNDYRTIDHTNAARIIAHCQI